MLTYELKKAPGMPLYESLYRCLRGDILSGALAAGVKLPSKRALAENLKVSKITVETAYNQLLSEGYIRSEEKKGYFVEAHERPAPPPTPTPPPCQQEVPHLDLSGNGPARFPFSVWSRLQRQTMQELGQTLLQPLHNQGAWELRCAIAAHLQGFRGMHVNPENIVIGAGTDFLYNLIIQLLGSDRVYAVEEPGYRKIRRIYEAAGVRCVSAPMDKEGVLADSLADSGVLHISPSHHFPTGIVTTMSRRLALLRLSQAHNAYIIEDDYDTEFRFHAHPLPALHTLDSGERVIYMNSFSKSLAPSIRVGFMVLPAHLMALYRKKLGFYSCTVPSFEQYTLARFLSEGHFEKHINRMRKFYRARRDRVAAALESCPWAARMTTLEEDAGLHFLVKLDTALSDDDLTDRFHTAGIRIRPLSHYYHGIVPDYARSTLLVNYSGLDENELWRLQQVQLDP